MSIRTIEYKGETFTLDSETLQVRNKHDRVFKVSMRGCYPAISTLRHRISVHRLFAIAFVPNPYNLPCVNHKDENKMNWNPNNLEWCTHKYNNMYSNVWGYAVRATRKSVEAIFPDGSTKSFIGVNDAARKLNIHPMLVSNCARGKQHHTHGLRFRFRTIDVLEGRQKLGKPEVKGEAK